MHPHRYCSDHHFLPTKPSCTSHPATSTFITCIHKHLRQRVDRNQYIDSQTCFWVQWATSISVGILCSMRSLARSPVGYRIAYDSQNQDKKKYKEKRIAKQMERLRCQTCKARRFASRKLPLVCNVLANAVTPTPPKGRGDMFNRMKRCMKGSHDDHVMVEAVVAGEGFPRDVAAGREARIVGSAARG